MTATTIPTPHPWTVTVRVGACLVVYRQCSSLDTALQRAHDCLRMGAEVQATIVTHDLPWLSEADWEQMPDSPWGRILQRMHARTCTCQPGTAGWARHHGSAPGTLPETFHEAMESYAEPDEEEAATPLTSAQDRVLRYGLRFLMARREWQVRVVEPAEAPRQIEEEG